MRPTGMGRTASHLERLSARCPRGLRTVHLSPMAAHRQGANLPELLQPSPMAAIQFPETAEIHPDVALVDRAKKGDTAAFEQLVRQYERQIFRVAQHITQNREDAEDITQDAFLKAYEKLDQFQGNSKFSTWLVRIAVNESLMRLRKRKTSKTVSMDADVQTEDGAIPR